MENEELVLQIQAGENVTENMEQLYLQNRNFIWQEVKKSAHNGDMEDLMQEAYFGLCKAAERFKPEKGVLFLTYAGYWIRQSVRRYYETCGQTKRISAHMLQRISKYKKYLKEQKLQGISPTDSDICRDLGLTEQQLKSLQKTMFEADCISISDFFHGTEFEIGETIADPLDMEEQILDTVAKEQVWKIVEELEERQAEIIIGRYKESKSLNEIAERLHLSNTRIGQIEANALSLLRGKRKMRNIAEIYGYIDGYKGTGLSSFKYHGSAVENAAIRRIEQEEKIKTLQEDMKKTETKICDILNIDELFEQVVNIASN